MVIRLKNNKTGYVFSFIYIECLQLKLNSNFDFLGR